MAIVIRYMCCLVFISRSSDLIQYGGIVTKANMGREEYGVSTIGQKHQDVVSTLLSPSIVVDRVKMFLACSLITVQNLIIVSRMRT